MTMTPKYHREYRKKNPARAAASKKYRNANLEKEKAVIERWDSVERIWKIATYLEIGG